MAKWKNIRKSQSSFDGHRTPTGHEMYVADRFIPSMPRLLPKGITNTNDSFWNH
ncbi:MAG: hypothetical protein RBQ86_05810 [Candidatus Izemoplasmatales bacterium]|nr:hypothetical protein [Candidatus Izemoplasmatales bacterium]